MNKKHCCHQHSLPYGSSMPRKRSPAVRPSAVSLHAALSHAVKLTIWGVWGQLTACRRLTTITSVVLDRVLITRAKPADNAWRQHHYRVKRPVHRQNPLDAAGAIIITEVIKPAGTFVRTAHRDTREPQETFGPRIPRVQEGRRPCVLAKYARRER